MDPSSSPIEETENVPENNPLEELRQWMTTEITALRETVAELANRPLASSEDLTFLGDRLAAMETATQEQLSEFRTALESHAESVAPENQSMESPLETPVEIVDPLNPETPNLPENTDTEKTEPQQNDAVESPAPEAPAPTPENPPARKLRVV